MVHLFTYHSKIYRAMGVIWVKWELNRRPVKVQVKTSISAFIYTRLSAYEFAGQQHRIPLRTLFKYGIMHTVLEGLRRWEKTNYFLIFNEVGI